MTVLSFTEHACGGISEDIEDPLKYKRQNCDDTSVALSKCFKDSKYIDSINYHNIGVVRTVVNHSVILQSTGFLISPRIVLTAAHAVYGNKEAEFLPRNRKEGIKVQKIYYPPDYPQHSSEDYAILVLRESVRDQLINLTLKCTENQLLINKNIRIYGYPILDRKESSQNNELYVANGQILQTDEDLIYHNVCTSFGMSGAPILYLEEQSKLYYVIGIHVGSSATYKCATKISIQRLRQISEWISEAERFCGTAESDLPISLNEIHPKKQVQIKELHNAHAALAVRSAAVGYNAEEILLFESCEFWALPDLSNSMCNQPQTEDSKPDYSDKDFDESYSKCEKKFLRHVFGSDKYVNGSEYEEKFRPDVREGIGEWVAKNEEISYRGIWKNGSFSFGEFEWSNKDKFGAFFQQNSEDPLSKTCKEGRLIDATVGNKYIINMKNWIHDHTDNAEIIKIVEHIREFFLGPVMNNSFSDFLSVTRLTDIGQVHPKRNSFSQAKQTEFQINYENSTQPDENMPVLLNGGEKILQVEYPNGTKYIGQLKNGKKHGSCTKFIEIGKYIYLGDWVEDNKEGHGCFYNLNQESFEDILKKDKKKLQIVDINSKEPEYIGEWKKNQKHGNGRIIYPNGALYHGDWKNDQMDGLGEYGRKDGYKYFGNWSENQKSGFGKEVLVNGDMYVGFWKKDLKHGKGKFIKQNRFEHVGQWVANIHKGYCRINFSNGDSYIGHWDEGDQPKRGKYLWKGGKRYKRLLSDAEVAEIESLGVTKDPSEQGDWEIDIDETTFTLQIKPDGEVYLGALKNGQRNGKGRYFKDDEYVGDWRNDKPHGKGEYIWAGGWKKYSGFFSEGQRHGKGTLEIFLKSKYEKEVSKLEIFTNEGIHISDSEVNKTEFCTSNLPFLFAESSDHDRAYIYQGEWRNNHRDGNAEETFPDGSYYKGSFSNNTRNGFGQYFSSDGEIYIGDWKDGQKHGLGEIKWSDGSRYKGGFVNADMEGEGEYFHRDGFKLQGKWKASKFFEDKNIVEHHEPVKNRAEHHEPVNGDTKIFVSKLGKSDSINEQKTNEDLIADSRGQWVHSTEQFESIKNELWLFNFLSASEDQSQQKDTNISPQFRDNLDLLLTSSNTLRLHQSRRVPKIFEQEELFQNPLSDDFKEAFDKDQFDILTNFCYARVEYTNGDRYIGFWKNGTKNGLGTYYYDKGEYCGCWVEGQRKGFGIMKYTDGDKYMGEWKDDKPNGLGRYLWTDGTKYEGEFKDGDPEGLGTMIYPDNDRYLGEWKNRCKNGVGKYVWSDGSEYIGWHLDGQLHGIGEARYANGEVYYGQWKDGYKEGTGEYIWTDSRTHKGHWANDIQEGLGLLRNIDGRVQKGVWKGGRLSQQLNAEGSKQAKESKN